MNKRPPLFVRFSTLLFGYESIKVFAHIFAVEEQIGRPNILGDRNFWIIKFFQTIEMSKESKKYIRKSEYKLKFLFVFQIEILNRFNKANHTVKIGASQRNSMNSQNIFVIALEVCANYRFYLFFKKCVKILSPAEQKLNAEMSLNASIHQFTALPKLYAMFIIPSYLICDFV